MGVNVSIKITRGEHTSENVVIETPKTLFIGRNEDCTIRFTDKTVSRFHCMLDIAPPSIKVRDFGSLNGTYVNDTLIGMREKGQSIEEARKRQGLIVDLFNGDKLRLGSNCEVQFSVTSDLYCHRCGVNVGLRSDDFCILNGDKVLCNRCKANEEMEKSKERQVNIPKPAISIVERRKGKEESLFPGFKVIRHIGHGGMGEVLLAESEEDKKVYAIKRMLPKAMASAKMKDSFLREASLANQLFHPNIVTQYSYYYNGDDIFIIMEYCDGGSIDQVMNSTRRLFTLDDARICIDHVLRGLAYAHTKPIETRLPNGEALISSGLVHRDLKPSNVFIKHEGESSIYKIADFGLAKAFEIAGLSGHTQAGQVAGTPAFMPRQQVLDYLYTKPEADVWSAAATLYYMLTGCAPKKVEGKDPWLAAVTETAVPLRTRNPSIPLRIAEVIDEALDDKTDLFFKTANDFQKALDIAFEHR